MNISKSITEALYIKRKSQTWLANEMGVSDAYVSAMCLGIKVPSLQKLLHIAKALGMKTSELIALGECEQVDDQEIN